MELLKAAHKSMEIVLLSFVAYCPFLKHETRIFSRKRNALRTSQQTAAPSRLHRIHTALAVPGLSEELNRVQRNKRRQPTKQWQHIACNKRIAGHDGPSTTLI